MRCPFCDNTDTKVVEKRDSSDFITARRRRECEKCSKRFTTYERVEMDPLRVIKKNDTFENFDRDKVKKSILYACEKRNITLDDIDTMVSGVHMNLLKKFDTEVPSQKIGKEVMRQLKKKDKVAYIRYACVFKEFADLDEFESEIGKVNK